MEGSQLLCRLDPQKVYLLRFVLEASGHVAWLSAPKKGLALLRTSRENEKVVREIVEALGEKIGFQDWL